MAKNIKELEKQASAGDANAEYQIATYYDPKSPEAYGYYYGLFKIERNSEKSIEFYKRSAIHGGLYGMYHFLMLYLSGEKDAPDDIKFLKNLRLPEGTYFVDHETKSLEFYIDKKRKNFSERDLSWGYRLGLFYEDGVAVQMDYKKARELYSDACDVPSPFMGEWEYRACEYRLGMMYLDGRGGERSCGNARRLLEKSAKEGFSKAVAFLDNNPLDCPLAAAPVSAQQN